MLSVNTNGGALAALQSLAKTNSELSTTQSRITTGLKVSSAVDNGAVFAIAEAQRTRVDALGAVKGGIDRAKSAIDFGVKAGEAVNDILKQMRSKAQEAAGAALSTDDRTKLQTDFQKLSDQIDQIVGAASYNGTNLASGSSSISVLTTDQSGGAASNFVVASNLAAAVTSNTTGQKLVASTATMGSTVTNLANDDTLVFSQTVGGSTNTYTIDLETTDTVDQFISKVNAATDGAIRASFNSNTGQVVYSSSASFTVTFNEGTGTAVDAANQQFLEGTGTAQNLAAGGLTAPQLTVAAGYGGAVASSTSSSTVTGGDFSRTGLGVGSLDISGATGTGASNAITAIDSALSTLRSSLSSLGSQSKALGVQSTFLGNLSDTLTSSVGNLVDADLAEESARLQSLQVKQQLGAQALSIANQSPQIILSFFR
jgi:flagellin